MATPLRAIKYWWLIVAFLSGLALAMLAEDLILESHDNRLEFLAPRVHFLSGKPLERLRNAAEVPFDIQVTLWAGDHSHVSQRAIDEFVVSYDLWQETFSVTKLQSPRRAGSHFTASAAEAWCLEQMAMDITGIPPTEPLWARLEIRAQGPPRDGAVPAGRGHITETGISLTSLIEIFSRPPPSPQPHWEADVGPVTLDALRSRRR
jgi:hypothetical protein